MDDQFDRPTLLGQFALAAAVGLIVVIGAPVIGAVRLWDWMSRRRGERPKAELALSE